MPGQINTTVTFVLRNHDIYRAVPGQILVAARFLLHDGRFVGLMEVVRGAGGAVILV